LARSPSCLWPPSTWPAKHHVLTLDLPTLGIISAALVVVDAGLFVASRATFQREEILTRWK
jgi:hypothetical protein